MKNKVIFYSVWLLLLTLSPITVFSVTPWSKVADSPAEIANLVQRLIGLWAYTLLFIQIILGAFMTKWTEKLGGWVFKFHVFEGLLIYTLIILHPLAFTFFNYFIGKGFDPFYTFVDVCIICKKSMEYSYNFGRIGFWLLTIGVTAGLFRMATPFLRIHWRKFHLFNYVAFLSVWYHSIKLGSDVSVLPFTVFYFIAVVIVFGVILLRAYIYFRKWNL